jgi:hypothetical protein
MNTAGRERKERVKTSIKGMENNESLTINIRKPTHQ